MGPDARPHGVPLPPTALIGRARELAALSELLASSARLVTIVGPAGVGKTRLALEVAQLYEGALFVGLASVNSLDDVAAAALRVLGVERAGSEPKRMLIETLRESSRLLVLDNFEHLLDGSPMVADIVSACPGVTVLITSRAALRLVAERVYVLVPLALPAPDASLPAAAAAGAVALFAERVTALNAAFTLDAATLPVVSEICTRLEGLPLALELAAARARALPLEAIAAGLDRQLGMLGTGPRDLPERQRTMRDALAWSWELLDRDAAEVLARMSMFSGGGSLAAVREICAPLADPDRVLDLLDELVAHSLVVTNHSGGEPRFRLLQVVREYAAEQLSDGARESAGCLHARHYSAVAQQLGGQLADGRYGDVLDRLARDRFNLQAAVEWLLAAGDGEAAQRLCIELRSLWYLRGPLAIGRSLFNAALALPGASNCVRARATAEASALARQAGDRMAADELAAEAVALARATGEPQLLTHCLLQQGFNAHLSERFELAQGALEESAAVAGGDPLAVALARHHLGFVAYFGDGDAERAHALERFCLDEFRALGRDRQVATALFALAELARARHQLREAQAHVEQASEIIDRLGDLPLLVSLLASAAALAADHRRYERAFVLLGAAEALQRTTTAPLWPTLARVTGRWIPRGQRAVGTRHEATLRRHGMRLPTANVIELLRNPNSDGTEPDPLTAREREIAERVGRGATNRQIAATLVISERTVDGHVANILRKLGFRTRSQIAAWIAGERVAEDR